MWQATVAIIVQCSASVASFSARYLSLWHCDQSVNRKPSSSIYTGQWTDLPHRKILQIVTTGAPASQSKNDSGRYQIMKLIWPSHIPEGQFRQWHSPAPKPTVFRKTVSYQISDLRYLNGLCRTKHRRSFLVVNVNASIGPLVRSLASDISVCANPWSRRHLPKLVDVKT